MPFRSSLLPSMLARAVIACAGPEADQPSTLEDDLSSDTITSTTNGTALATAILGGGKAVTITSAQYTGPAAAVGTYLDGPMALKKGMILTTGSIKNSLPPSKSGQTTLASHAKGSSLCGGLVGGATTYDAATLRLTFDLEAGFDGISLLSVFGSEEYPEYVGSSFNDVYGIFLNGKQIAFDESGAPITINGPFFTNGNVVKAPATGTEYDGSTSVLNTRAPLVGGSKGNVLEIVICDTGDDRYDSGVFVANLAGCIGADCSGTKPCEKIDADRDGYNACNDCDDSRADVHPGGVEVCDKVDNDCDNAIDEGLSCKTPLPPPQTSAVAAYGKINCTLSECEGDATTCRPENCAAACWSTKQEHTLSIGSYGTGNVWTGASIQDVTPWVYTNGGIKAPFAADGSFSGSLTLMSSSPFHGGAVYSADGKPADTFVKIHYTEGNLNEHSSYWFLECDGTLPRSKM